MDVFHEVLLTLLGGILRSYGAFDDCLWILPRTPTMMVMRGLTFHHTVFSVWTKGMDLLDIPLVAMLGNLP